MPLTSMCQMLGSLSAEPRHQIRATAGTVSLGLRCRLDPFFTAQSKLHIVSMSDTATLSKSASLELYCIANEGSSI